MSQSTRKRYDRLTMDVSDEKTKISKMSIDVPIYFPVDTNAIWKVLMREMTKQENKFNKGIKS